MSVHGDHRSDLRGIPSHTYVVRCKWEELEPTSPPLQKYRSVFRAGVKLQTSNETRKAPKATAETGNG